MDKETEQSIAQIKLWVKGVENRITSCRSSNEQLAKEIVFRRERIESQEQQIKLIKAGMALEQEQIDIMRATIDDVKNAKAWKDHEIDWEA